MPVPKRRNNKLSGGILYYPSLAMKLFDVNFVFQKTRLALLYGFAPTVLFVGMMTEPRPASWLEIINILE